MSGILLKIITAGLYLSFSTQVFSASYYVATNGQDSNPGSEDSPMKTIPAAIAKVNAGDSIIIRAGNHTYTSTISISKSGAGSEKIYMVAFKGEHPVLDFSGMSVADANQGIKLSGNYWFLKGFSVKGAGDNGLLIQGGSNNRIEFCEFFENRDAGCQLKGGAANNQIINCDSYYNMDPGEGNADGFAPKMDVGTGNYFYGCRSWQNSDDGWDGYLRGTDDINTTLENCWCFKNGYRKDGSESTGNGNGFKMGGSDDKSLMHNFILKNCLSFQNRVKGYDQNNNKGSMTLYNCTAFSNGTNYKIDGTILGSGKALTLTNCISAGTGSVSLTGGTMKTNSWMSPFSVSNGDFISVDPSSVTGPRKADGSLPDVTFMHLAAGSDLIDAGTIGEVFFNGLKPDLGCFETGATNSIAINTNKQTSFVSLSPMNTKGTMKLTITMRNQGVGKISLYDLTGRSIIDYGTIDFNKGLNEKSLDMVNLSHGTYLFKMKNTETGVFQSVVRK
jgi:hypothetical protein